MERFHKELKCSIEGITFKDDGVVVLKLSTGHCTDMMGAVAFVHQIVKPMPYYNLAAIVCEAEGEPTYAYMPAKNGDSDESGVYWSGRHWVYREERR
jgi:hypothetical protein